MPAPETICEIIVNHATEFLEAFVNIPYLSQDACLRRVYGILNAGMNIECKDFNFTNFDSNSGFYWDSTSRTFYINLCAIKLLMEHAKSLGEYENSSDDAILGDVLPIYFFHELFHIVQGISDFSAVQKLKSAMGKHKLGELDTHADFISARAYAAIIAYRKDLDEKEFANVVFNVLELSYTVGLRAFGIGHDAPHKINRALSMFLARERIHDNTKLGTISYQHCYAIYCFLSAETGVLVACTIEEDKDNGTIVIQDIDENFAKSLRGAIQFGNLKFIEEQLKTLRSAA